MENYTIEPLPEPEITEMSFTDKLVGIFTEPKTVFKNIAAFPLKNSDWAAPFYLMLLVASLSTFIMMSNTAVRQEVRDKTIENARKSLNEQVAKGNLSREQAAQQEAMVEKQAEFIGSPIASVFQTVAIFIFGSIVFFLVAGIYTGVGTIGFRDEGTYKAALIATGMVAYISVVQLLLITLATYLSDTMVKDLSLAMLLKPQKGGVLEYFLLRVDPLTIWVYYVTALGLATLFKAKNPRNYYLLVFGLWLSWTALLHFVLRHIPFFAQMA